MKTRQIRFMTAQNILITFDTLVINRSFSMRKICERFNMLKINILVFLFGECSKNVVKGDNNQMISCVLMNPPGTSKSKKGLE